MACSAVDVVELDFLRGKEQVTGDFDVAHIAHKGSIAGRLTAGWGQAHSL